MTTPLVVLLSLLVGISVAMYFYLRPLQFFSNKEWLISHGFMFIGLGLVLGWLWFNWGPSGEIIMLMGGIWTLAGGLCFVAVYAVRGRLKR